MAKNDDRHVVPNSDADSWDVEKPHHQRVSSRHDTQAEAIERGREIVENRGGGEDVIHGRDGWIREKNTVGRGRDPHPPQG